MKVADLYDMAMESDTAYKHMERLCELLGVTFPPDENDMTDVIELMPFIKSFEQNQEAA